MARTKLAGVAASVAAILMLSSCAPGANDDGDASANTGDGSADAGEITLTFQSWEASPLESEAIAKGIAAFENENPGVKVKYVTAPFAQHHTKLKTQMASGTAPDVFFMNPEYQRDFIESGQLLDLTPYFDEYWDIDDFLPSSIEKIQVKTDDGDAIYGVDVCAVGPVLFYNKDLFDEAGVDYPPSTWEEQWTWDEFVENITAVTKKENGKTTQYGTANFEEGMNLYTTQQTLASNGAEWFSSDFTEATGIDTPVTAETLELIKGLRDQGLAPDPASIGLDSGNSPTQLILSGQVASIFMGSYGLQELAASNLNLGAGLPPKMADGTYPMVSCNIDSVWSETKHPEEAIKLVTFLTSMDFATPIYETGLWMPNRLHMYEPENVAKWMDPEVYPEGWENMVDLWKDSNLRWFDRLTNADTVYTITDEELQAFFYDNQSLDDVLPRMQQRINEALAK